MRLAPQRIELRVEGCRATSAPATFAQRALWSSIEWVGRNDPYFNFGWTVPIPDGTDVQDVAVTLRRVLEDFDTLRTTFKVQDGALGQTVASSGSMWLDVYDAAADSVEETADAVLKRLVATGFRSEVEWPMRPALVITAGRPQVLVLAFNHLALDLRGWFLIQRVLHLLLASPCNALPPVGRQPVDQAAYEVSPAGQAANRIALDRYAAILRATPPTLFDFDTYPDEDERFWMFRLDSPAAATALALVAERTGTSDGSVLMTVASLVVGALTGHTDIVLQANVANRIARGSQRIAGYMCQDSLFRVELDGCSFDDAARRGFRSALDTYRHGMYDPAAASAIRASIEIECGAHIDLGFHVNDRRHCTGRTAAAVRAKQPNPAALLRDSRLSFVGSEPRVDTRIHLHAWDPEVATISLELMCDTRYVPAHMISEVLRAIERLLVEAAAGDQGPDEIRRAVGLSGATRGPGWERHTRGWVHTPESRQVWRSVVGSAGALFADAIGKGASRLVAYVAGDAARHGAGALHAAVVRALGDRSSVRAPDLYVCCTEAPSNIDDASAWALCDVLELGTGRPHELGAT